MDKNRSFSNLLAEDGKKNSLGRVNDVIEIVFEDSARLEELYENTKHDDAWVRMRAIDAFEKVCRQHPDWIKPYIPKIQSELALSTQASIQWHIAQIYEQVELSEAQKSKAITWLKDHVSTTEVDWIVAANCMKTLAAFTKNGHIHQSELTALLKIQQGHKSNAVVKRATKLLSEVV